MTARLEPRSALRRLRGFIAGAVLVLMALFAGAATHPAASLGLWTDTLKISIGQTITSGSMGLDLLGFEQLDHEYTLTGLSTQGTVTVVNAGNVPLHGLEASISAGGGLADLLEALDISFTPAGGGTAVGISGWLQGLTLAPGQSVQYTATTSIASAALLGLIGEQVTSTVTVTAASGGNWSYTAQAQFAQSVGVPVTPPPPANVNMSFTAYSDHNIDVAWVNPPGSSGSTVFHMYVNGVQLPDQGNYHWPHHSLDSGQIPSSMWPAAGQTVAVTITVTADGGAAFATGTIWLTGVSGGAPTIAITAP
jgi:hypothetical protein